MLKVLSSSYSVHIQVSDLRLRSRDEISGTRSALYALHGEQSSQKAISLPSSPHQYRSRTPERNRTSGQAPSDEMVSTWNKILETRMYHDKSLLPYEEWNIDYSELTEGTRVGIGKLLSLARMLLTVNFVSSYFTDFHCKS